MNKICLLDALKGIKIWNATINCKNLTLVIPKYEDELADGIPKALMRLMLVDRSISEKVSIIFTDIRNKNLMWDKQLNIEFIQLSRPEMDNLVSYMLWTAKHVSAMRNANVKLVMLENLCGGQIQHIYDMKLFSNVYIIYDKILRGV